MIRTKTELPKSVFVADGAVVIGDVRLGEDVNIWYNATLRADADPIIIGDGSNVQDNSVIHIDFGYPVKIGKNVTIGHGVILHGCEIGDNTLIGMGAILLNGCKIGKNCIVGAGALVTQGTEIPDGSLVLGSPAKIRRELTEEEIKANTRNAKWYVEEAKKENEAGIL